MPDIDLQITGETGETGPARDSDGRFLTGHSDHPTGRPRGSSYHADARTRSEMFANLGGGHA